MQTLGQPSCGESVPMVASDQTAAHGWPVSCGMRHDAQAPRPETISTRPLCVSADHARPLCPPERMEGGVCAIASAVAGLAPSVAGPAYPVAAFPPSSLGLTPNGTCTPNGMLRRPRTGTTGVIPNAHKPTCTALRLGWRASGNYITDDRDDALIDSEAEVLAPGGNRCSSGGRSASPEGRAVGR
jgi:hypothetical protein